MKCFILLSLFFVSFTPVFAIENMRSASSPELEFNLAGKTGFLGISFQSHRMRMKQTAYYFSTGIGGFRLLDFTRKFNPDFAFYLAGGTQFFPTVPLEMEVGVRLISYMNWSFVTMEKERKSNWAPFISLAYKFMLPGQKAYLKPNLVVFNQANYPLWAGLSLGKYCFHSQK